MSLRPPIEPTADFISLGELRLDLDATVRNETAASPINTDAIFQGIGGADPTLEHFPYYPDSSTDVKFGTAGEYNDNTGGNLIQHAVYARNSGDRATVGLWSSIQGEHSFGANPGAVTLGKGTAIGIEVDVGNFTPITTTSVGSQALPVGTFNVASTAGIFNSGTFHVTSGAGTQTITFTGITATSFTGCTGGTGTVAAGATVSPQVQGTPAAYGILIASKQNGGPPNPSGVALMIGGATGGEFGTGILFHMSGSNQPVRTDSPIIAIDGTPTNTIGLDLNPGAFTTAALRIPVNSGSAAQSYGLLITAKGGFANTGAAIQIGTDGSSTVAAGLAFFGGVSPVVSNGALIVASGGFTTKYGLDFTDVTFSTAALALGNSNHISFGIGAGGKIGVANTDKLAFWGGTPAARPAAITGSRGANAALADLLTKLAATGLIVDSTTV